MRGRVSVDGRTITNPRHGVIPERAAIAIDRAIRRRTDPITILLHKPRGVVTTRSDPEGRPTVYDLLTDLDVRVVPVGRLDLATSGVLLLTNDTRFADWLTDPKTALDRVYLVTVRGRATPETAQALVDGVTIGSEHLSARDARVRKASNRESHLVVTLQEGKNREIRRSEISGPAAQKHAGIIEGCYGTSKHFDSGGGGPQSRSRTRGL